MYPLLEIKKGASVTPIETYISWEGFYKPQDRKFCCLYHLRDDKDFINFEKDKLINNKLFHDFKQTEDGKGIYVFDFNSYAEDWDNIIKGKYSKLTPIYKRKIENFHNKKESNYAYIESFLYPEKYYSMYSEMIGVAENLLKDVGELCSLMDFEKENLHAKIKNLELKSKLS